MDKYKKLIEQHIRDMEAVDASPDDFIEGLRLAKDMLSERLSWAESKLRNTRRGK